jgi:methionine aminopeptidase
VCSGAQRVARLSVDCGATLDGWTGDAAISLQVGRPRPDDNGWTVRSTDGSRGAHVEHTVAITDDGPVVLTAA